MFDGKKLFDKVAGFGKKVIDNAQQTFGKGSFGQGGTEPVNPTNHTRYEAFSPAMGMGKKFAITENSLIFGTEEYSFSRLTPICITDPPEPRTNGVASTNADGKELVLAYDYSQRERFARAMIEANEQIDRAHGTVKNYLYMLQTVQGTKIEVYEDYLILYELKSGFKNILGNAIQGGSGGEVVYFGNIAFELNQSAEGWALLMRRENVEPVSLEILPEQKELAQKIIDYRNEAAVRETPKEEYVPESWEPVVGNEKQFYLNGKSFTVSSGMDAFNSYRIKFYELASVCAEKAEKEYIKKVQNLATFLEFFPKIYLKYLEIVAKRAVDILISESIWTVTQESFIEQHIEDFHDAVDIYSAMTESVAMTIQANQDRASTVMSFVPNLVGGGFGVKGAAKGIAQATAFNLVRDGAEAGLIQGASRVSLAQQNELYQRVDREELFQSVLSDYWSVSVSLVFKLNENGKGIWTPSEDSVRQASNIFRNLSNPNFPQDKLLDVFFDILRTNPYVREYQDFMITRFGETPETKAIKDYFSV